MTAMADFLKVDGWALHAEERRRSWLALTPEQRLRWLEQAKEFCRLALGAAQQRQPPEAYSGKGEQPK